MGEYVVVCFFTVLLLLPAFSSGYRLNVPKVLLPYHISIPVNFTLEVTDPEGGCFIWRSSRPEIAAVTPVQENREEPGFSSQKPCSDRAVVSALSRHPQKTTAIVFAEDKSGGVTLRCDIMVDRIHSVEIITTTRELFLEDAPEAFVLRAQNDQEDTFSELGGIPLEWSILKDPSQDSSVSVDPHKVLRIIPFSESKYETPPAIERLEREGRQGDVILMEGTGTGTAVLNVRLLEDEYKDVKATEINLVVIANLMLNPSQDIYVPVHSVIHYKVELIKQGRAQEVSMPSKQYYLELKGTDICSLNTGKSHVTALKRGQTEISLKDRHIRVPATFHAPTAFIFVTGPVSLHFVVEPGRVWVLETDRIYEISLEVYDNHGKKMYIPENARLSLKFDKQYFSVVESSRNGSFYVVKTLANGHTLLEGQFNNILKENGELSLISPEVSGQQGVEIFHRIKIEPDLLIFPWDPVKKARYNYQIQATGGSGNYSWMSNNKKSALVSERYGVITTVEIGNATVTASDLKNRLHRAAAQVWVTPPSRMEFAESEVEVEVGKKLNLHLAVFGRVLETTTEQVFRDCTQLEIEYSVADGSVFRKTQDAAVVPENGCSTVTFEALKPGDTKLFATHNQAGVSLRAEITVSAFEPLKILDPVHSPLVALGSGWRVGFGGGPRPWVLDSSKFFTKMEEYSDDVQLVLIDGVRKSKPEIERGEWKNVVQSATGDEYSDIEFPLYCSEDGKLLVGGLGSCAWRSAVGSQKFDNISSLIFDWTASVKNLVKLPMKKRIESLQLQGKNAFEFYEKVETGGREGLVTVTSKVDSYKSAYCTTEPCEKKITPSLEASVDLFLTDFANVSPQTVSVFNHPSNKVELEILKGSGHFEVRATQENANVGISGRKIQVVPKRNGQVHLEVFDLCLGPLDRPASAEVTISDIFAIEVTGPHLVELDREISLSVRVLGGNRQPMSGKFFSLMNLKTELDSSGILDAKLTDSVDRDEMLFSVRGLQVGSTPFVVTGRQCDGRKVASRAHSVQVYAPLALRPKHVWLIVDSLFQLEILGGPQPSPGLKFWLNDSSIARVGQNGMVSSLKLGHVTVTGCVVSRSESNGKTCLSQDDVFVHVVSLSLVRIHVPVSSVHTGMELPVYAVGGSEGQSPWCFGGAKAPLSFEWTLDNTDVAELNSVYHQAKVWEMKRNSFARRLLTKRRGHVTIRLKVTLNERAEGLQHFLPALGRSVSDAVQIRVVDPMRVVVPSDVTDGHLLLTPNTETQLTVNRAKAKLVTVNLDGGKTISVDSETGILKSGSGTGKGTVLLTSPVTAANTESETLAILVEVLPVAYLRLNSELKLSGREGELRWLPVGYTSDFSVSFHDSLGRKFHATNNVIEYRPNRFDLTEIFPDSTNRSLSVQLKQNGETVLKVWDRNEPKLRDFVRIPVGRIIEPILEQTTVGDIVCLVSPVGGTEQWTSDNSQVMEVDRGSGVGVVRGVGTAWISQLVQGSTRTTTKFQVNSAAPESVWFSESFGTVPNHVTNLHGGPESTEYIFPFVIGAGNKTSNLHGPGCLEKVESMEGFVDGNVPVSCWLSWDRQLDSNPNQIFAVSVQFNRRLMRWCNKTALSLNHGITRWEAEGGRWVMGVGLKRESPSLWNQYRSEAGLTDLELRLTSQQNGQDIRVPVTVKLYGEPPKLAAFFGSVGGLWSVLDVVTEQYGSGILVIVAMLATLLAVYLGYRLVLCYVASGPIVYSGNISQHSINGPSPSYVQWRTHGMSPGGGDGGRKGLSLWSTDRSQNSPWSPDKSTLSSDRSWGSPQYRSSPVNRSN